MISHINVTEETTRKTFKSLLKKHAFPPNSEYTDYYGASNILHDILDFFGTKSIVDSVKLYFLIMLESPYTVIPSNL